MQIRLQTLEHQQRALTAITRVFHGVDFDSGGLMEANPVFDLADPQLAHNISELQNGAVEGVPAIPGAWRGRVDDGVLGIDVKMETGTGKTLVYTQMMYELTWSALLRPYCQLKRQVAGHFSVFRFSLVWSDLG